MQNNRKLTRSDITIDHFFELFTYHPDGKLVWNIDQVNGSKKGDIAGSNVTNDYLRVRVKGVSFKVHRVIWSMANKKFPKDQIDHIDNNFLNNKIENLREANTVENCRNQFMPKNNTSGIKGVSFCKKSKKWMAYISANKKLKHLGYFDTKELAAEFRQLAAEMVYGNFARHA